MKNKNEVIHYTVDIVSFGVGGDGGVGVKVFN